MESRSDTFTTAAAHAHIRELFTPREGDALGVELEIITAQPGSSDPPLLEQLTGLIDRLAGQVDSAVSLEPGGQIEVSSRPYQDVSHLVRTVNDDLSLVEIAGARHGVRFLEGAVAPAGRRRILSTPRYAAMERYFGAWGAAGTEMMCETASLQVNVDVGATPDEVTRRWRTLHAVGPAMIAAFTSSRVGAQSTTLWSRRQLIWSDLDPSRIGAVPTPHDGTDLATAYADWALSAPVMLTADTSAGHPAAGHPFRSWTDQAIAAPAVTQADWSTHLTTLFPHVRARGYFEVRYPDAHPLAWWAIPVGVLWALVTDPAASAAAEDACRTTAGGWDTAARDGLADDELYRSANNLLEIAAASLRTATTSSTLAERILRAAREFTAHRRSPGLID